MMMMRFLLHSLIVVSVGQLSATIAFARSAPEPAADPKLPRIELLVGYEGVVPNNGAVALTVVIASGEAAYEGRLTIEDSYNEQNIFSEAVALEPGEMRRLRTIHQASGSAEYTARLIASGFIGEPLSSSGRVIAPLGNQQQVQVLFVDLRSPLPFDLNTRLGDAMLLGARPVALPEEARAYWMLSGIVFGRIKSGELDRAQTDALALHVASGGTLILTTGARSENLDPSVVGSIIEGVPAHFESKSITLPLLGALGFDRWQESPIEVADLSPLIARGAIIELADGDVPLAVSVGRGQGRVVVLAVDLWREPLAQSPASELLVQAVIGRQTVHPGEVAGGRALSVQGQREGFIFVVALSLLVLVATALTPWIVARRVGQPLMVWFYAPVGALIAVVLVALVTTVSLRGETRVLVDELEWWPEHGGWSSRHLLGAIASQGRIEDSLRVPGAWSTMEVCNARTWHLLDYAHTAAAHPDVDGRMTTLTDVGLGRWESRILYGVALERDAAPPIRAHLQLGRDMVVAHLGLGRGLVSLKIEAEAGLTDALVVVGDQLRVVKMGEIPVGVSEVSIDLDATRAGWRPDMEAKLTRQRRSELEALESIISIGLRPDDGRWNATGGSTGSLMRVFALRKQAEDSSATGERGIQVVSVPVTFELYADDAVNLPGALLHPTRLGPIIDDLDSTAGSEGGAASTQPAWQSEDIQHVQMVQVPRFDRDLEIEQIVIDLEILKGSMTRRRKNTPVAPSNQDQFFVALWDHLQDRWVELSPSELFPAPAARSEYVITGELARGAYDPEASRIFLKVSDDVQSAMNNRWSWGSGGGLINLLKIRERGR